MQKMLATSGDFERYMNFKRPVIVVFEGDKQKGLITSHDDYVVKVNGEYFVKACCVFWSE